jgi:DNA ligase-1
MTFCLVEATTKRLKIIATVANFLRSVMVLTPDDLISCVYLCTNDLAPAYAGIELGIGDMILQKAIAQATGRSLTNIRKASQEEGDLGENRPCLAVSFLSWACAIFIMPFLGRAAVKSTGKQAKLGFARAAKKLTVQDVFKSLKEIALLSGNKVDGC